MLEIDTVIYCIKVTYDQLSMIDSTQIFYILQYIIKNMKTNTNSQLNDSSDSVEYLGEKKEEQPDIGVEEVDFDLKTTYIKKIKLIIQNKKENSWNINVQKNQNSEHNNQSPETNKQPKPKQTDQNIYNIKRAFADFQWLADELRKEDDFFVLPSVGKDNKQEHLNRFLQKICLNEKIINSNPLQIFISQDSFEVLKIRYYQDNKPTNTNFIQNIWNYTKQKFVNMIPNSSSDSQLTIEHKKNFNEIQRDVTLFDEAIHEILISHTQYLKNLQDYDKNLVSADEQYNSRIEKLYQLIQLIKQQIIQNKNAVGRPRTKQQYDKFQQNFRSDVQAYTKNIQEQLKEMAKELDQINKEGCQKISELFRQGFKLSI